MTDERDRRDERQPGDPRDERRPVTAVKGLYSKASEHPLLIGIATAVLVAGGGYTRMDQIVEDNHREVQKACEQRNMAWDRTVTFVEEISDNPDFANQLERLRDVGIVDC